MRLFAGIHPPEEACAHLAAYVRTLHISTAGGNTRRTPRAQWHITLAFLGEVPDARLPDVEAALTATTSGGTGPARLRIAGGGRFGRGRSTLLWAGLTGDVPRLTTLGAALRRELGGAGLPFDTKPFHPHLTLARVGDRLPPEQVEADRAALDAYQGPEWPLTDVRLMHSRLHPTPTHTELARFPL